MIDVVLQRFAALLRAPTHEELSEAAGMAPEDVRAALQELHDAGLVVLQDDRIRSAGPFSGVPTEYVAVVNGRRHFGTDAFGAFGIVARLGGIGRVEQGDLRAECAIRRVSAPRDYVVVFAGPPPASGSDLHRSAEESATAAGATTTVDTCWRLARAWYGELRPRTPEEAQAILASVAFPGS